MRQLQIKKFAESQEYKYDYFNFSRNTFFTFFEIFLNNISLKKLSHNNKYSFYFSKSLKKIKKGKIIGIQ